MGGASCAGPSCGGSGMLAELAKETFRIKGRRVANKSCPVHERDAPGYAPSLVATTACLAD